MILRSAAVLSFAAGAAALLTGLVLLGRDTAYIVAEITPQWRQGARGWSHESLLVAFRPNRGGRAPWEAGPRRVRLTGWLNHDHPHDREVSAWSLLHGAPQRTGWELHPVTRIETWDDGSLAWRELRR